MTHCAKCSQPLHLTGPHACSVTRGNAVPEVDLLRAEVFSLNKKLDAALKLAEACRKESASLYEERDALKRRTQDEAIA